MHSKFIYTLYISCMAASVAIGGNDHTRSTSVLENASSRQHDTYTSRATSLVIGGLSGVAACYTHTVARKTSYDATWSVADKVLDSYPENTSNSLQFLCGVLHDTAARYTSESIANYVYPNMQPHLFRLGYNLLQAGYIGYVLATMQEEADKKLTDAELTASYLGALLPAVARITIIEYKDGKWYLFG